MDAGSGAEGERQQLLHTCDSFTSVSAEPAHLYFDDVPADRYESSVLTTLPAYARPWVRGPMVLMLIGVGLACWLVGRGPQLFATQQRTFPRWHEEAELAAPAAWLFCAHARHACWERNGSRRGAAHGHPMHLWRTRPAELAARVGDLSRLPGVHDKAYAPVFRHWSAAPPTFRGRPVALSDLAAFLRQLLREDPFGTGGSAVPYVNLHAQDASAGGKVIAVSQRQLAYIVANVVMGNDLLNVRTGLAAALRRCGGSEDNWQSPHKGYIFSLLSFLAVLSQELGGGSHGSHVVAATPEAVDGEQWRARLSNSTLKPPAVCKRSHGISWHAHVNVAAAGPSERFHNFTNADGTFLLKNKNGRFLTASPEGDITFERAAVKDSSNFRVVDFGNGSVALRSWTGNYVDSSHHDLARAVRSVLGPQNLFERVVHADHSISFRLHQDGQATYLGASSEGGYQGWTCGLRDFMAGGTPFQSLTDIAGHVVGGGANLCDLANSQDESLVHFYSEVLAFSFFADDGQMLWVPFTLLGARRYLNYLGGETSAFFPYGGQCGALSDREWLNQDIPSTKVPVPIAGLRAQVAPGAFVAVASSAVEPCPHKLAVNNLCSDQRAHLDEDVALWYQAYEAGQYHARIQGAFRVVVRRVGTGPWGAGVWWGDSQQSFLTVWLATSLLADGPELDYYVYSHFCENPANQCLVLGGKECRDCIIAGQRGYVGDVDPKHCGREGVQSLVERFAEHPAMALYDSMQFAHGPPTQVFDRLAEQSDQGR